MSLVFPSEGKPVVGDGPRLHALVIGVSHYPHLPKGGGPPAKNSFGLAQISTPTHTATAIKDWLTTNYKNPSCPLGSVEFLLSPAPGSGQQTLEAATMANLETGFNRWLERCNKHRDNMAFFYFCGHGIEKLAHYLLPEDFGDPVFGNAWRNCIDFTSTKDGMRSCRAQTQVYFVDACRETPEAALQALHPSGIALASAEQDDNVECSAVYLAAGSGRKAYGPKDGVSFFGKALIRCLEGAGCANQEGNWEVTTVSLGKALSDVMRYLGTRAGVPLRCDPHPDIQKLLHVPTQPKVITEIRCLRDGLADRSADITLTRGSKMHRSAPGEEKPLECELEPGEWNVRIVFPDGRHQDFGPQEIQLYPPLFSGVQAP